MKHNWLNSNHKDVILSTLCVAHTFTVVQVSADQSLTK